MSFCSYRFFLWISEQEEGKHDHKKKSSNWPSILSNPHPSPLLSKRAHGCTKLIPALTIPPRAEEKEKKGSQWSNSAPFNTTLWVFYAKSRGQLGKHELARHESRQSILPCFSFPSPCFFLSTTRVNQGGHLTAPVHRGPLISRLWFTSEAE